jgi:hypothetical protein
MNIAIAPILFAVIANPVFAQLLSVVGVEFSGNIEGAEDLSAVQRFGDALVIASDEGASIQVLERVSDGHYAVKNTILLLPEGSTEIDIEALALDDDSLYVLGSHSWARHKVNSSYSQEENRDRLSDVEHESTRDGIYRFGIDTETGSPNTDLERKSLRALIKNHRLLKLFAKTPGKENGIDFEGLAAKNGWLYLGLRGPVLRGNFVPVLSLEFDNIEKCSSNFSTQPELCQLLHVNLDGRGIRSLHSVQGGFLILAGPVSDGDFSYQFYFWDGRDCVPGKDSAGCQLDLLADMPAVDWAGPEGFTVLRESSEAWDILMVYDGIEGGAPALFRLLGPR